MNRPLLLSLLATLIYFSILLLTLGDYNVSWDETIHFRRGQAYLHYFLTGRENYSDLTKINLQGSDGDPKKVPSPRRSLYQNDYHNGQFFLNNDQGHPPLNDEIAAFFNYVLYQKLGLVDDIFSYHLFNILASSLAVLVVVYFMLITFGEFAAMITFLVMVTYPLFFGEAHFNIKDPPESAFFAATILCGYLFHTQKRFVWVILGTIGLGLSLGTKFNVLFLPIIFTIYLLLDWYGNRNRFSRVTFSRSCLIYTSVIIGAGLILLVLWPYLWADPVGHFLKILNFYKSIGTGTMYQSDNFFIGGFNTYPILWILLTSPPVVLILTFLGILAAIQLRKKFSGVALLWLTWLVVPILRVMLPGAVIYGGIRQILEFLPAMALLAGLGADWIVGWIKTRFFLRQRWLVAIILIGLFLYPFWVIVKMHPHQNLYFNSLIGGLEGASKRHFPSSGNSFGNAYKMGIDWINKNAESNAKLALIQGTPSNAPPIWLRSDIRYLVDNNIDTDKSYFSGINRQGEYIMELTYYDTGRDFYYTWDYVDAFLKPVFELKVEGVAILKIWKNDLEHTREGFKLVEKVLTAPVKIDQQDQTLTINLGKERVVSKFKIGFGDNVSCQTNFSGRVGISRDGSYFEILKDIIPQSAIGRQNGIADGALTYYMAGKKLQFIRITFADDRACPLKYSDIEITELVTDG